MYRPVIVVYIRQGALIYGSRFTCRCPRVLGVCREWCNVGLQWLLEEQV